MNKLLIISMISVLAVGDVLSPIKNDIKSGERNKMSYDNRDGRGLTNPNNLKTDRLYIKECGSCHMAYQPEFLPRRSWKKMMATLSDHFGTDASLEPEEKKAIYSYLMSNAVDTKRVGKHFTELASSIKNGDTPLRISDTPYFKEEHSEIPIKLIEQKEVKSISNCNACHKKAEQGDYHKRNIIIPNYGAWKD